LFPFSRRSFTPLSQPTDDGSDPVKQFDDRYTLSNFVSLPSDDGRLPQMLVDEICRLVSALSDPMLDGSDPLSEYRLSIIRYCSFVSFPIDDGREPDSDVK
jgi:hypothetical protein